MIATGDRALSLGRTDDLPMAYHVDIDHNILASEWNGALTIAGMQAYFAATRADRAVTPGLHRLLDLRRVVALPRTDEIREMVALMREYPTTPEARFAVLVASDLGFGVSMMFKAYSGLGDRFYVFRDEGEALSWLSTGYLGFGIERRRVKP